MLKSYFQMKIFQLMTVTIRLSFVVILSTVFLSCSGFPANLQQDITRPTLVLPIPEPSSTNTATPSVIPDRAVSTPTRMNDLACTVSSTTPRPVGWDCLNQSYGFTVHFPAKSGIARTTSESVDVWLENSPSNPRVERSIEIITGESAKSCFSSNAEEIQIGEHNFTINNGFEPSGVVYAWKSYAISQEAKSVCFMFVVGFQTWNQDDPLFPPEKDQGLNDVEAIVATFRWLNEKSH